MAQAAVNTILTSSLMVGKKESYGPNILNLAPWETKLLNRIGLNGMKITNTVYHYEDLQERPMRTTLNGNVAQSATTVVLTDAIAKAGDYAVVDGEVILLGTTNDNLTFASCTRSVGAGADHALTSGQSALILSAGVAEGAAGLSTPTMDWQPDDVTNYIKQYRREAHVSKTALEVSQYGIEDLMQAKIEYHLKSLKKELEHDLIYGVAQAAGTNATAGMMNGIYERVIGVNTAALGSANLTMDEIRTRVRTVVDWGGGVGGLLLCCNLKQADNISSYHDSHQMASDKYGVTVRVIEAGGVPVEILPMDILSSDAFLLTADNIKVGPLNGGTESGEFASEYLGLDGLRYKSQISGNYGCMVACPRSHFVWTGVAVS